MAECVEGVPWQLLSCELDLVPALRSLAASDSAAASDAAVIQVLRAHPFVTYRDASLVGNGLESVTEEHYRLNINAFRRWLRSTSGAPFAKEAGGSRGGIRRWVVHSERSAALVHASGPLTLHC